jgi:hypothetical protein
MGQAKRGGEFAAALMVAAIYRIPAGASAPNARLVSPVGSKNRRLDSSTVESLLSIDLLGAFGRQAEILGSR